MYDLTQVRADFPILHTDAHPGVPLVYLDSAASSQKPLAVLAAMDHFYRTHNANVHRGIHRLSEDATNAYETARQTVARFINAPAPETIIFTRNATEAVNLVAASWGRATLRPGDEIVITEMEHHANIVPWQLIAEQTGATLRWFTFHPDGTLDLSDIDRLITPRTRMVAFTAVSNVFGTFNPVRELVAAARAVGALTLVDGAQAVPHMPVDVQAQDCDFMVFSGHKMCGPTGSGVLYGKQALLEAMPPYMGGGDMIRRVTMERSTWAGVPAKFEAGTPAIAEAIGLAAAADYLSGLGMANVFAHEQALTQYALEALATVPGLRLYGPADLPRGGVATFTLDCAHPHDIAQLLDTDGIAIRAGHHCAMPLHRKLGLGATARASFYLHTTSAEIDQLVTSLHRVRAVFGRKR
jgi:cysteine desulfurase/selenocysteine lyase